MTKQLDKRWTDINFDKVNSEIIEMKIHICRLQEKNYQLQTELEECKKYTNIKNMELLND